jgi:hypothetical protein
MKASVQRALVRLDGERMYARQDYDFWARQEHRLTRDEYALKMRALRRVQELERAKAKLLTRVGRSR